LLVFFEKPHHPFVEVTASRASWWLTMWCWNAWLMDTSIITFGSRLQLTQHLCKHRMKRVSRTHLQSDALHSAQCALSQLVQALQAIHNVVTIRSTSCLSSTRQHPLSRLFLQCPF
jgi:hypothetical protein